MSRPPVIRQLPLEFGHESASGREDLIISDRLNAAVAIVDRWPDWPSPVVVLAGPTGSGKSHLAGIWAARVGAQRVAIAKPDPMVLAAAARGPVLIEDIDRTGFDQIALFHLINAVREHGSAVLMTSRLWPAGWQVTLPDLASRLKAATVVEIAEPDEQLLAQVMVKLFADRQVVVDDRIISWLVARMERSLAAARHIVTRLDQQAMARGSRITRAMAAEVLAEMDAATHDQEQS
ncbi:DnaA regulatory inactivator HdaA [Hoeflea sp. YIM 152468]|uniref:DnaA regulatory inactivator HdaA n=1 Tax=Hoeflea sp. YIM 152468 TaxID=3031759 RepID=UPI0023DC69DC|nr:DnaA regulatory inactivator HdaA [Hoeflea sp. YIM 152468]MDF1607185.1 DnaA regulatory inactivator HdaA [Hoeflea sp. YIM 152468]